MVATAVSVRARTHKRARASIRSYGYTSARKYTEIISTRCGHVASHTYFVSTSLDVGQSIKSSMRDAVITASAASRGVNYDF